jgi:hypothetical protein
MPASCLLSSVRFGVVPGRMLRVIGRMQVMGVCHVCVMGGLLVVSAFVRFRGFAVVVGGLRVVMRRLIVMVHSLL